MSTCKTCKYRDRSIVETEGGVEYLYCSKLVDFMLWDRDPKPDRAYIHGGIDSSLLVGPDFGCLNHEPLKEPCIEDENGDPYDHD